jgi:hypothetical protein
MTINKLGTIALSLLLSVSSYATTSNAYKEAHKKRLIPELKPLMDKDFSHKSKAERKKLFEIYLESFTECSANSLSIYGEKYKEIAFESASSGDSFDRANEKMQLEFISDIKSGLISRGDAGLKLKQIGIETKKCNQIAEAAMNNT